MNRNTTSGLTRFVLFTGLAAIAASISLGEAGVRKPNSTAVAEIFSDYPGPCIVAPSDISLTYLGQTSGCTPQTGACLSDEQFLITAVSNTYVFQDCDSYKWAFGDDGQSITTYYFPWFRHSFLGAGPRTVDLTVTNSFGSVSTSKLTVPEPVAACTPGSDRLCFFNNQFKVTLFAKDPRNPSNAGPGQSIVKTDLFGFFSIPSLTSDPNNAEVFVKILDGRAVTGSFWVFWGGLTDLEYNLTVTDSASGKTETYFKPGRISVGGADTSAFTGPAYQAPPGGCPSGVKPEIGTPVAPSTCSAESGNLCLLANRFKVSLSAVDPRTSATGTGMSIPENDLFGFFSLPDLTANPNNPEVFVKILDGRAITGNFWVFYGSLTDFEFTVRVEDTETGAVYNYRRPAAVPPADYCGGFDTGSL